VINGAKKSSTPVLTPDRSHEVLVRNAECELDVAFPSEYREYMVARNGTMPDRVWFVHKDKRERYGVNWVGLFAAITDSMIDPLNLRGHNQTLTNWAETGSPVPRGCIAIGSDCSRGTLLLFVTGKRKGQVWLKDWDLLNTDPAAPPDPEDALYYLAPSFGKFLQNLYNDDQAEQLSEIFERLQPRPKPKPRINRTRATKIKKKRPGNARK